MPKKPQRPTLKGIDNFFQPPAEEPATSPASQDTSKPASQDTDFIKGTYYITIEDDLRLERIRLARRKRGQRVDKSALVREAIRLLNDMDLPNE